MGAGLLLPVSTRKTLLFVRFLFVVEMVHYSLGEVPNIHPFFRRVYTVTVKKLFACRAARCGPEYSCFHLKRVIVDNVELVGKTPAPQAYSWDQVEFVWYLQSRNR